MSAADDGTVNEKLAGLLIQLLVAGSMTGLFFVLTIWLQSGEGFSPVASGLTAVAFCAGMTGFARLPGGAPAFVQGAMDGGADAG